MEVSIMLIGQKIAVVGGTSGIGLASREMRRIAVRKSILDRAAPRN